jgi:hypothetical protein
MKDLCTLATQTITGPPYLRISTDDNLMSSLWVSGSFDAPETWANGIYENSRGFRFVITPHKGKRYYVAGEPVTVELVRGKRIAPFRTYTGTPDKVLQKIAAWIHATL